MRELDERLGLSVLIAENIKDEWRGKNTQLPLPDLLRQSIYSRLAGYEDVNDAERLSQDPTEEGDCLAAKLRPGNVHSAEDWDEVLLPEIARKGSNLR